MAAPGALLSARAAEAARTAEGPARHCESAARYAIKSLGSLSAETHLAMLRLIDELVALGSADAPDAALIRPRAVAGPVHARPVRT